MKSAPAGRDWDEQIAAARQRRGDDIPEETTPSVFDVTRRAVEESNRRGEPYDAVAGVFQREADWGLSLLGINREMTLERAQYWAENGNIGAFMTGYYTIGDKLVLANNVAMLGWGLKQGGGALIHGTKHAAANKYLGTYLAGRSLGAIAGGAKGAWETHVTLGDKATAGDYLGAVTTNAFFGAVDPLGTTVSSVSSAGGYYGAQLFGADEATARRAMLAGDLVGNLLGGSIRSLREGGGRAFAYTTVSNSAAAVAGLGVSAVTGIDPVQAMAGTVRVANLFRSAQELWNRVCFAAGTPLLTPTGTKPIEKFKVGDVILSRRDDNPNAPVVVSSVEEVFKNFGPLLNVHVGGKVIRTTAEHPFWVKDKGWTEATRLTTGDLLSSHDGQWIAVEEVYHSGEYETVYNLRVADYHTYFVGGESWGFSVWAHNTYLNNNAQDVASVTRRAGLQLEQRGGKWVTVTTNSRGQEVVRSATGRYDFVTVNGQTRVLRPGDAVSTHTALAGNGPVDYAGQIVFSGRSNRGQIRYWDNGSGHFTPGSADAANAGLPMNLFRPLPGT